MLGNNFNCRVLLHMNRGGRKISYRDDEQFGRVYIVNAVCGQDEGLRLELPSRWNLD